MESGYQVKIISNECLNNEAFEITDEVYVPTLTDAVDLVGLLAKMDKGILSIEIKVDFGFSEDD